MTFRIATGFVCLLLIFDVSSLYARGGGGRGGGAGRAGGGADRNFSGRSPSFNPSRGNDRSNNPQRGNGQAGNQRNGAQRGANLQRDGLQRDGASANRRDGNAGRTRGGNDGRPSRENLSNFLDLPREGEARAKIGGGDRNTARPRLEDPIAKGAGRAAGRQEVRR